MKYAKCAVARVCATAIILTGPVLLCAQQAPVSGRGENAAQPGRGGRGPQVISPEVLLDRRGVFRLLAPNAQNVGLSASDLPRSVFPTAGDQGQPAGQPGPERAARH